MVLNQRLEIAGNIATFIHCEKGWLKDAPGNAFGRVGASFVSMEQASKNRAIVLSRALARYRKLVAMNFQQGFRFVTLTTRVEK